MDRRKATVLSGSVIFVFTIFAALSFGGAELFTEKISGFGKTSWFLVADHFVSNWMLPTGGFAVAVAAGWFMTRRSTEEVLIDGNEPRWFHYPAWRFFIRFISPAAVLAIIIAVILGGDFS